MNCISIYNLFTQVCSKNNPFLKRIACYENVIVLNNIEQKKVLGWGMKWVTVNPSKSCDKKKKVNLYLVVLGKHCVLESPVISNVEFQQVLFLIETVNENTLKENNFKSMEACKNHWDQIITQKAAKFWEDGLLKLPQRWQCSGIKWCLCAWNV